SPGPTLLWLFGEVGIMQKGPVLAEPFQDCERLALRATARANQISANLPLQAMSEGASRSFYRRTTALGDAGRYYLLALDCPGQAVAIGSAGLAVILRFAQ